MPCVAFAFQNAGMFFFFFLLVWKCGENFLDIQAASLSIFFLESEQSPHLNAFLTLLVAWIRTAEVNSDGASGVGKSEGLFFRAKRCVVQNPTRKPTKCSGFRGAR